MNNVNSTAATAAPAAVAMAGGSSMSDSAPTPLPPALTRWRGGKAIEQQVSPSPAATKPAPGFAMAMVGTAALTGVTLNLCLGDAPGVGLNFFIPVALFFGAWMWLSRQMQVPLWRKLAAAAAMIYAAAMAFRAAEILYVVNLLLCVGFSALACSPAPGKTIYSLWQTVLNTLYVPANAAVGALLFVNNGPWDKLHWKHKGIRVAGRVLSGVIIAVPFLAVFGLLFSRADSSFGELFSKITSNVFSALVSNFWLTFFGTVVALGLLRSSFLVTPRLAESAAANVGSTRVGFTESATVLTLVNLLFAAFVLTQIPYFFGGMEKVTSTPNLVLSEYARQGFFELAVVITLLVPTLLLFLTCTRVNEPRQQRALHGLSIVLSGLAVVVAASALQRMLIYTSIFGLTELRIYVSLCIVMFMVLIALLNGFAITNRLGWFLPAALVTGFTFSVLMQVPNVQGMVANDTIARSRVGKQADVNYLRQLSTDAVPAIARGGLPVDIKRQTLERIVVRQLDNNRTFNWFYQPLSVNRALNSIRALPKT